MCLLILWPNVNFSVCKPSLHFLSIVWYFSLLAVRPLCWSLYWPSACNLWNTSKLKWPHWCVCMFYPDLKHAVNSVFFTVAVLNVNTFVLLLVLWFSCWGLGFVLHVVPVFSVSTLTHRVVRWLAPQNKKDLGLNPRWGLSERALSRYSGLLHTDDKIISTKHGSLL